MPYVKKPRDQWKPLGRKKQNINEEELKKIKDLLELGVSYSVISKKFNISYYHLRKINNTKTYEK